MGFCLHSFREKIQEDFQNPPVERIKSFIAAFLNSTNLLLKICKMYHRFNFHFLLVMFFFDRIKKIAV